MSRCAEGAELLDDPELHLISVTANATSDEEDEAAESAEAVAENAAE